MDSIPKLEFCILDVVISVLRPPLWAFVKAKFAPPTADAKGFGAAVATI